MENTKEYFITLLGEPKSTGATYKTMCRGNFPSTYMVTQSKTLKQSYIEQAQKQWKGKPIPPSDNFLGNLDIKIELHFGTKRKCDWDNFHKLSMDSLKGIVWEDDSQVKSAVVEKFYCTENPRIELTIKEL